MDKIKHRPIPHDKREATGIPTGLLNCNGDEIITGDFIAIRGTQYDGPVLWNRHQGCYGVFMGLWYGDKDLYNPDCYGKFIRIPKDNGMRMELIPTSSLKYQ